MIDNATARARYKFSKEGSYDDERVFWDIISSARYVTCSPMMLWSFYSDSEQLLRVRKT